MHNIKLKSRKAQLPIPCGAERWQSLWEQEPASPDPTPDRWLPPYRRIFGGLGLAEPSISTAIFTSPPGSFPRENGTLGTLWAGDRARLAPSYELSMKR